ncbi:MAG TPA: DUF1987 domain-containing protein [Campylobacterales bacterium]|nr:DUF1987 domain-containing protein [Campylobacterales bacterium]HIO70817.1 DUF1987 domain-containing protein [Campylobacterales bacterium]
MRLMIKKETKFTPYIELDPERGVVEIRGKSYPENSFEFYKPIMEWIENYFQSPQKLTKLNIELVYFNSSSSKFLFDLFEFLENRTGSESEIVINWIYDKENDMIEEAGQEFQAEFPKLDIRLIIKVDGA